MPTQKKQNLLILAPITISVGLEIFAETLEELGFPVVQVDWRPPAGGDQRLAGLLSRLEQSGRQAPEPRRSIDQTGNTYFGDGI